MWGLLSLDRMFVGAESQTLRRAMLDMGPVGMWGMDESSGPTGYDISGNGHDGTYTLDPSGSGTIAYQQGSLMPSGEGNSVLVGLSGAPPPGFTDVNGLVVPSAPGIVLSTDATLVAWSEGFNLSFSPLFSNIDPSISLDGFNMFCRDGHRIEVGAINAGVFSQVELDFGEMGPHLYGASWNAAGIWALWVNGVKIGTAGGFGSAGPSVYPLIVCSPVTRQSLSAMYNRALADDEMLALWRASQ